MYAMAMRRFAGRGGMQPQLVSAPTSGMGMLQTNDIGEFRIAGLAAGEYYIAATRSINSIVGAMSNASATQGTQGTQGTTLATTYFPGTTDQNAAQPVAIAEGDTKSGIEFRMLSVPSFRISGRVVDEQGAPVARAMVMLAADPRGGAFVGPAGNAQSGDDGRFTIGQVPSGSYRISASVPMQMNGSSGAWSSVSGGVGGVSYAGSGDGPPAVVVNDADVSGLTLTVRRPQPR